MAEPTLISAIQMNSTAVVADNLATAGRLLAEAADAGAVLAALPENFAIMGARDTDKLAHAEPFGRGPIQDWLAETAQRLKLWIVAGTVPVAVDGDPSRVWAASLVFDASGAQRARYDKIHLFDVDVPSATGERYRESRTIAHGAPDGFAVVDTPAGRLGLSVCYDVRFPELYRALAARGAEILCVPAAFTAKTGEAHWDILLRARAIENQCYVIAPGETGSHAGGRQTWGHSMIIGPWGDVLAVIDAGEGLTTAAVDRTALAALRAGFPNLSQRRIGV